MSNKLKKYVCVVPFMHMEIFKDRSYLCCPSWLPHYIKHDDKNLNEVWNDVLAQKIRASILDGSYSYCSKDFCPSLNSLLNTDDIPSNFIEKENLPFQYNNFEISNYVIENSTIISQTPGELNFTFDKSCNLKCPSCRNEQIMADSEEIEKINNTLDYIENNFSKNVRKIFITGSGDPFASRSFRRFLKNFDKNKFKDLNSIHLSTNGNLFNKDVWEEIKNSRDFIKMCEISIDAATKDTYENKVRLNGNWDILMENLKFIISLDSIKFLRFSFVVQEKNYKEISTFIKIIYELSKDRIKRLGEWSTVIYFSKIDDWYVMSEDVFNKNAIWKKTHPNYIGFVKEINNIPLYADKIKIQTNFNDLITNKKML